jgi:SNF2 family DNA or RNA helicase
MADRGAQLKRFNNDPTCEVFVASLQAAGLGIDLTAASVVIHYDRWWNAAKENQATDRVHRIGQKRGVQVFKLMTQGTLEEHIDFLISKKARLLDDIVSVDDHQMIKKLDRQEIIALLKMN